MIVVVSSHASSTSLRPTQVLSVGRTAAAAAVAADRMIATTTTTVATVASTKTRVAVVAATVVAVTVVAAIAMMMAPRPTLLLRRSGRELAAPVLVSRRGQARVQPVLKSASPCTADGDPAARGSPMDRAPSSTRGAALQ